MWSLDNQETVTHCGAVALLKKKNNPLLYLVPQERNHTTTVHASEWFILSVESITMNVKRNDKFDLHCYKYRCLICCGVSYDVSFCTEVYVEPTAR